MKPQIVAPQWLSLPLEVRLKLAQKFGLQKSGYSQIEQHSDHTRITSDGHTNEDLAKLSVEVMQEYLETSESDPWTLLTLTAAKVMEPELAFAEETKQEDASPEKATLAKKRGRPKKNP